MMLVTNKLPWTNNTGVYNKDDLYLKLIELRSCVNNIVNVCYYHHEFYMKKYTTQQKKKRCCNPFD